MALEQLGVEAVVKGADKYVSDLQRAKQAEEGASSAAKAMGKAGDEASGGASGVDKFKEAIGGVSGFVGDLVPQIAALGTAFGAAFALRDAIDTTVQLGQEISTLQRNFGGTAEQASALHFALQETGVGFDKGNVALTRFSKALAGVSDLEEGNLPVGKALSEQLLALGIHTQTATGVQRPFFDVLSDTAAVFKSMPDGIDKTALATQIFGRSGKDLLFFLNQGADGLKEMSEKAAEFGLVLDQDLLDKLIKSKQAQREFNEALEGIKVTIGAAVLPIMTDLIAVLTKLVSAFSANLVPVLRTVITFIKEQFVAAFQRAVEFLTPFVSAIADRLVPALLSMGSAILDKVIGPLSDMFGFISNQSGALEVFGSALSTVAVAFVAVGAALPIVTSAFDVFSTAIGIITNPLSLVALGLAAVAVAAYELYTNWGDLTERFPILLDAADAVKTTLGGLVDVFVNLGSTINDEFGDSATQAFEALAQAALDVANAFREEAKPIFDALVESGQALVKVLVDMAQFMGRQLVSATNDVLVVFSKLAPLIGGALVVGIKAVSELLQALAIVLQLVAKYVDPLDFLLLALAFNMGKVEAAVAQVAVFITSFVETLVLMAAGLREAASGIELFELSLGPLVAVFVALDVGLRTVTGSGLIERLSSLFGGAASQADKASDSVKKFNEQTSLLSQGQKLTKAQDDLKGLVDKFTDLSAKLADVENITNPFEKLNVRTELTNQIGELTAKVQANGQEMRNAGASTDVLIGTLNGLPKPLQDSYAAGIKLTEVEEKVTADNRDLAQATEDTSKAMAQGAVDSRKLVDSVIGSVAPMGAGTQAALELGKSVTEVGYAAKTTAEDYKILIGAISDTNPVVLELKAKSALLAATMADLVAAGKNVTDEEKAHIDSLQKEKDALDNQVKAFDSHAAAIDAVGKALATVIDGDHYGAYLKVMEDLKVPQADFVADTSKINDAFVLLNQGSISNAISAFDEMKTKLDPRIWAPIGDAVGPKLVQAIDTSFGPGPERDALLNTVYSLGLAVPPQITKGVNEAATTEAPKAAAAGEGIGESMVAGVTTGIDAAKGAIKTTLSGAVTEGIDYARAQAGISSPSKKTAEEVGKPLAEGVAQGITDETANVLAAGSDLIGQLIEGMRQEGETKGKTALDGLLEGLDLDGATDRLKQKFGDSGSQLMEAFAKALEDGSYASGKALSTTLANILDTLPTDLVPGIEELGSQLMDAFITAMTEKTPEAIAAVETIFGQIQSEIKAAGTLTVDTFRNAFSDIFADAQLKDAIGSEGASLMDALNVAIEQGGQKNIASLANMAVQMRQSLFDKLPPEQAEYWATLLINAINNAITNKGPEAVAALQGVLGQIHDVLSGGAFDVATQTQVAADAVKGLADAFGVGLDDVVTNITLFVQTGLVDNVARLKDLPDLVVKHVQSILKGLGEGRITMADAIDAITHLFSTIPLKAATSLTDGAPQIRNAAQVLAAAVADGITAGMNIAGPTSIQTLENLLGQFNTELGKNLDTGKNTAEERIKAIWDVIEHTTEVAGFPAAAKAKIDAAIVAMELALYNGQGVATADLQALIDSLIQTLNDAEPDLAAAAASAGAAAVPTVPAGSNGAGNSGIGPPAGGGPGGGSGQGPSTSPTGISVGVTPIEDLYPGAVGVDPNTGQYLYWNGHYWQQDPYTPGTPTQADASGAYYDANGQLQPGRASYNDFGTSSLPKPTAAETRKRRRRMFSFDEGTNFLPFDTMAFLHRGEAVIPRNENPWIGKMPPWFSTLVRSMPAQGPGAITVDLSGSTFTGTPIENASAIEDAVKTALAEVLDRDAFLYGQS